MNAENENKFSEAVPVRKKNSARSESAPAFGAAIFEFFFVRGNLPLFCNLHGNLCGVLSFHWKLLCFFIEPYIIGFGDAFLNSKQFAKSQKLAGLFKKKLEKIGNDLKGCLR